MQRDRPAEMRTNHFAQVKRGGRGWGPLLILGMLSPSLFVPILTDSHRVLTFYSTGLSRLCPYAATDQPRCGGAGGGGGTFDFGYAEPAYFLCQY